MGVVHLATQLRWATARLVVLCFSPIQLVNGLLLVCSRWCMGHEMLQPQGKCIVKKMWTRNLHGETYLKKYKIDKSSGGIQTD